MRIWPNETLNEKTLRGAEGELILISVSVDPRRLEQLLETLALLPFPVNPQIYHAPATVVSFPAYADWVADIRRTLTLAGFAADTMQIGRMRAAGAG